MDYIKSAEEIVKQKYDSARQFHEEGGFAAYFRKKREQYDFFCVFGAGVLGTTLCRWLQKQEICVDFFCDNQAGKQGNAVAGVPVLPFERLYELRDRTFVMISVTNKGTSRMYQDEIRKQLQGFPAVMPDILKFIAYYVNDYRLTLGECVNGAGRIMAALRDETSKRLFLELLPLKFIDSAESPAQNPLEPYYDPLQYFSPAHYMHREDARIVDCGAFKGDTLKEFLDLYGERFETYDCFEMDRRALKELDQYIGGLPSRMREKIRVHPVGVYSESRTAHYQAQTDTLGSVISECGGEETRLAALDEALAGRNVTMIQMDIEGSELPALMGAEKLILENRPVLAISIYHSTEQFFRVPLYIMDHFPFYQLSLGQHTAVTDDTVLYASPE